VILFVVAAVDTCEEAGTDMGGAWHVISARMSIPPPVLVVAAVVLPAGNAGADNKCCAA